ncbi:MAG: hypothetical protein AB7D57_07075 [Desulfovibrionaceae bacterium]
MIASTLLTALSGKGKWIALALAAVLLAGVLAALAAWRGYSAGYDKAEALGRAELTQVRADHAVELADRWAVAAAAEREARSRYQARAERGDRLAAELARVRRAHAAETDALKREISEYAHTAAGHRFSPAFVRLFNRANRSAPAGADEVRAAAGAERPAGASGAADPADAGLVAGAGTVTEADLLANTAANGERCAGIAEQLNRLIDLVESWREDR